MAEIDVQPKQKRSRPVWPWLLALLGLIALIFALTRDVNDDEPENTAGTYSNTSNNAARGGWAALDWNAPRASYDEIKSTDIDVRGGDHYAIYGMGEDILFEKDQATLRSNAEESLRQVATSINQRYGKGEIRIYGHTDAEGSTGANQELGRKRAETVRDWLKENGIGNTITIESKGETQPKASNETAGGQQQNRRVEIVAMNQS